MLSPRLASGLQLLVGTQFQVLFHSPPGVLFAFPSRYLFTIGHCRVFSLRRWSSRIPTKFLVFRCTWDTVRALESFVYRAITFFGSAFQQNSTRLSSPMSRSHDPHQCYALEIQSSNLKIQKKIFQNLKVIWKLDVWCWMFQCEALTGLGCFGFARRYSRNHYCFLFLRLLRCFSSAGCLPPTYAGGYPGINRDRFSHSEIPGSKLFWQLPEAYRSQSRPSSTCSAKASTMCRNNLINSQLDKQELSHQSGI